MSESRSQKTGSGKRALGGGRPKRRGRGRRDVACVETGGPTSPQRTRPSRSWLGLWRWDEDDAQRRGAGRGAGWARTRWH